ncbi:MAG: GNAT family N-acetyltransferase [Acidobacteriota bacterium]|nr:MAG: GNAT family N-acetyltransferase [Acidobacteriota bacterium]
MEISNVIVRPFAETDLNEWFRLRRLLWDGTADEDHQDEMYDIISDPESQFVAVADDGSGGLCGFIEASIRPMAEDCESEDVGYLEGWFVEEHARRQGIGRALVASAENWAREHGCIEMASDAELENSVSLNAHTKLGYSETSRLIHLKKYL